MEKVVAYASQKWKSYEMNYPTHDMDLAIVAFALEKWTYYLYGVNFEYTNHKSLEYLFSQKDQHRWIEFLEDYDCTINYQPRKANVIANLLSKKWR